MDDFDWNIIKRFKEIINAGNLENAQQILNLSHASIYNNFSDLEKLFDKPVIKKYQKGNFFPTAFGELLLEEIEKHFNSLISLREQTFTSPRIITIAGLTSLISYLIGFYLDNIKRKLDLSQIKIRCCTSNPLISLNNSDILVFEKIKVTKSVESVYLGTVNYALYSSKESYSLIMDKIQKKEIIDCIGCSDSSYSLSEIDVFIENSITSLTNKAPNFVVDTDSSMNEYIACYKNMGISCLCINSPLIDILKLKRIDIASLKLPIYMYYKNYNSDKVLNIIPILKPLFE